MWITAIIIALISAILDVTIAPSVSIWGGVISFTTASLLIFLVTKSVRGASVMLVFSTIFLVILSQVPAIYILLPNFTLLLLVTFLTGRRLIDRPSTILSFPVFFVLFLVFGITKLLVMREISFANLFLVVKSGLLTALFSTIIYFIVNKLNFLLNPHASSERVKINI